MAITGYEIDFLPVGEESSSGDAILFRYNEDGILKVILIDGGYKESNGVKTSDTILNHLRTFYFPGTPENVKMPIEHIICSHPHNDHVGGLEEIMAKCHVRTFWINNPLHYTQRAYLAETQDNNAFSKADSDTVVRLIKVANEHGIAVKPPLQGEVIGPLVVASPSAKFYEALVKGKLTRKGGEKASFKKVVRSVFEMIRVTWNEDALFEFPATSVCNESSTVLFGSLTQGKRNFLLTADAGIEALSRACAYLEKNLNFQAGTLNFMQMPHHGGRRNVNKTVLDSLLGAKVTSGMDKAGCSSIASVAKEAHDYPKKAVTNAFTTRGYSCSATKGKCNRHIGGEMPIGNGWEPVTPIPFSNEVEALDE